MVDGHYDKAAVWAGNLLCAVYGRCRTPSTGGGSGDTKSLMPPPTTTERTTSNRTLQLNPNPARGQVAVVYELKDAVGSVELVMRDPAGREVDRLLLGAAVGRVDWTISGLPAGVYTVELRNSGHVQQVSRLVLQP
jgi:hypothetical protein